MSDMITLNNENAEERVQKVLDTSAGWIVPDNVMRASRRIEVHAHTIGETTGNYDLALKTHCSAQYLRMLGYLLWGEPRFLGKQEDER